MLATIGVKYHSHQTKVSARGDELDVCSWQKRTSSDICCLVANGGKRTWCLRGPTSEIDPNGHWGHPVGEADCAPFLTRSLAANRASAAFFYSSLRSSFPSSSSSSHLLLRRLWQSQRGSHFSLWQSHSCSSQQS